MRARAGELSMMVAGTTRVRTCASRSCGTRNARFQLGFEPGLGATMKLVNNLLAAFIWRPARKRSHRTCPGLDASTIADVFGASSGQSWILGDRLTGCSRAINSACPDTHSCQGSTPGRRPCQSVGKPSALVRQRARCFPPPLRPASRTQTTRRSSPGPRAEQAFYRRSPHSCSRRASRPQPLR